MGKLFHEHALAFGVGVDILIGVGEMFGHAVDLLSFVKSATTLGRKGSSERRGSQSSKRPGWVQ
jgi:hypothetical protein